MSAGSPSKNLKPDSPEPSEQHLVREVKLPINMMPDSTGEKRKINSGLFNTDTTKTGSDSLKTGLDSLALANADSLRLDSLAMDSTARLENFKYQRTDEPYVTLQRQRESNFFAKPSPGIITRKVTIDSTGKFVEIRELVNGKDTKILLRMPLEEYIDMKLAMNEKNEWQALGHQYQLKEAKKGLGELIKDITDFEIPLPSVGVLSIFGEPKISLRIGGAVDIHGAWRNETTEGVTASRLGNTRNEPDFKQQVQINVNGTIGDKLNINADWNTERTFEYENQLKIKYTGYEDEIVQSVEAGNVSLQTSPLVGGGEALFGIKAKFQMGPFSLTALASQKKGEVKEVSVNSGATSSEFNVRAYDYSTNNYFVDTLYASENPDLNLFYKYYGNPTPEIVSHYRIKDIQVWKSINVPTIDRSKERIANAYIDLPEHSVNQTYDDSLYRGDISAVPGKVETGRFVLLSPDLDYTLHEETGYITFKTQIQDDDIIAVAYRVENGPGADDDGYFGEFIDAATSDTTQKLVLKLIKPANLQPQYKEAWKLQLRNIYPIGGRNIKQEGFEFQIKYEIEGQEPVTEYQGPNGTVRLLNAFGLDEVDAANQPHPDNIFDFRPNITIIPMTGEIIFPHLRPFGTDLPGGLPDSLSYNAVYDTNKTAARQDKIKDKWLLTGKYSGEATSTYQLGFNIVENSVRVILNGRELKSGVDYVVDYNIGQLTIRNPEALVVGADLKITYEQNDLFQLASKTLLGARGMLDISDKTKLGFSILNLNQQTLSDKVRIGEEPLSNTIYGVDFNTSSDLPFLTRALDNIISTREMSSFTFNGEFAYMNPDPNTKKSTIASDNGESIAYIDDFEGAKRIIPIGVSYTAWKDLSAPDSLSALPGLSYVQKMDYKGKSFWFTETPSDVNVSQIWPLRKTGKQDQQVTVMDYVFLPDTPGTYNYHPKLDEPKKDWGGIMKTLSSTANNLVEQNVEFIEFWAKVVDASPDSKIYIDLGRISEDVIPNRKLDTEDKDNNGVIDAAGKEDVGLDGMTDDQERDPNYNMFLTEPSTKADPSGDNFYYRGASNNLFDYFSINGTQGNFVLSDIGRAPDTEDLNNNGNLDLVNSYFRYEIPLDTNRADNKFIVGGGDNGGWYLFRIPLKDTLMQINQPSFTSVDFIRMFVTNQSQMFHIRLVDFNLVGNQWQKAIPEDSILSVSVINVEDNPNYVMPPGIQRERDRTRPDENILRNEQSLNLIYKDLPAGESRDAVKYLYKPLDVFNYRQMKLYIHGDLNTGPGSISSDSTSDYPAEVYFRFGGDTNNFYEYRQPVRPDWQDISIAFDQLTAIKQSRDSTQIKTLFTKQVEGKPGHFYGVKGNPTLTAIKFLTVGVYNRGIASEPEPLSGEVWVNELRVIGADNKPGWAYSISSQLKLADLLTVNFNMSQTDPNFHKLSDRFGSRIDAKNWSLNADLNILKLLPFSMPGSSLSLKYTHTESMGKPTYLPGTDIKVSNAALMDKTKTPEQVISESQTLNVSDSWTAANIRLKIPSSFWLIEDTFNAMSFGFTYNKQFSRSPTVLTNKQWTWNANMNYNLNLGQDNYFYPMNIPIIGSIFALFKDYRNTRIYYTPQNFSFKMAARRNSSYSVTRARENISSTVTQPRDFTTTRGFNFGWKMTEGGILNLTTNYSVNMSSTLAYLLSDAENNARPESQIWRDIFSGAFFGRDYQMQQSFDLRTAPRLPTLWDINRFFTINAGYSSSYQWNYQERQGDLGRSAGFSSKADFGLTLRWKALTQPLFESTSGNKGQQNGFNQRANNFARRGNVDRRRQGNLADNRRNDSNPEAVSDTSSSLPDSLSSESGGSPFTGALLFAKSAVQSLFFDYETITLNFSNSNTLSKSGIKASGTGFYNFWGVQFKDANGPSRGFMLGLNSEVGPRAYGNIQDAYSQKNDLNFKTSRPLWEGAKLDLDWKVGWSVNKTTSLSHDSTSGAMSISNITSTGTLNRSFLSLPPVLFLSSLKSGIKQVHELYSQNGENLSTAFVEGFETLPIFSRLSFLKDFAKYVPRPNWRLSWDGLEKYFFFGSFAERMSLEHAYTSSYTEGWKITPDGVQQTQTQKVEYGFSPLIGLNITFAKLWGGNLNGSIKYSTRTGFDLGVSTQNITETFSKDVGITAGYSKSGFELPLFGIALKNDIEFSFSYSSAQNSTIVYEMDNFKEGGTPQNGTTRVTIEPRIKYTISSKVTLSIFYRRTSVAPEGAARIPPTTTNEAGLDVHISISGS